MFGPAAGVLPDIDDYRIDLSLTPRPSNARGCYHTHWNPHRFERLGKIYVLPPHETMQARSDGISSQTSILCHKIGRASCRERVCQYGWISGVAVTLKKKT